VDVASGLLAVDVAGRGGDLTAFDARVEPRVLRAGDVARVTARVSNLGDVSTDRTTLRVSLAVGIVSQRSDETAVPPLSPGQAVDVALSVRVPRDAEPGEVWFLVAVDPDARVPQDDRTNDETWVVAEVRGAARREVRLGLGAVARVGGERRATPGTPLDLRGRLDNLGGEAVEFLEVEAVLVGPTGSRRSLGRRPVPSGVGVAGADWAERFELPGDVAPGAYVVRLLVDPDRRLPWADGDAGRAIAELPVDVEAPAVPACDLAVLSVEDEGGPRRAPRHLDVSAIVLNRGPGAAPAFDATLYLASRDPKRPGVWLPLMVRPVPGGRLAQGVQTKVSFAVDLSDDVPEGEYRAIVVVDADARVDLTRRTDNSGGVDVRVGAGTPGPVVVPTPPATPGATDLVVVEAKPSAATVRPGGTLSIRTRASARAAGAAKTFRFAVFLRQPDGSYAEHLTSAPQAVPAVGAHTIGTLLVPVPTDARGRLSFHLQARPDGEGDATPADNRADVEVSVVEEATAPPAPPAPAAADAGERLPWVIAVQASGAGLAREAATPTTIVVAYPGDTGAAVVEVTLEAGGTAYPLGEFDVPVGITGATAAVRARLRAPSTAAAGPAHLVVRVRDETGAAREATRWPTTVR
jgi:hypothetical protein